MNKLISLSVFLVIALFIPSSAVAADVGGEWSITIPDPFGNPNTGPITFEQTGENILVHQLDPMGQKLTGKGTVKGNKIYWKINADTPMGKMVLEFEGTVEGSKMGGTSKMNQAPGSDWKAVKK